MDSPRLMDPRAPAPLRMLAVGICSGALVLCSPLWAPLLLAAWGADLLRSSSQRLGRMLRGRGRAASVLVFLVVLVVLVPLVGIVLGLGSAIHDLLDQLRDAIEGKGSLSDAFLGGGQVGAHPQLGDWAALATRHGASAWRALTTVARVSAHAAIGAVVFVVALYTFLVDGERAYAWLERTVPVSADALGRLAKAFHETGRGLLVAGGGTALVQGALATAGYVALSIPRGYLLGPLTAVCSIVPLVGTAIVWAPLAAELAIGGHLWRAVAVVLGGCAIGVVDNFLRPTLARYGRLELPMLVVLVSMLGGAALLGAMGALLGPLVVRLGMEALALRDEAVLSVSTR